MAAERQAPDGAIDLDLASELESALLGDLQPLETARPTGSVRERPSLHEPAPEEDADREALRRLLTSIRQGDGTTPAPETRIAAPVTAPAVPSPLPAPSQAKSAPSAERPLRPSPRREAEPPTARPAREPRARSAAAALPRMPAPAKAEPAAAPGRARHFNRPAIAISALVLLAAIGAVLTVRSLTAQPETAAIASTEATPSQPAATTVPEAAAPASAEAALPPVMAEPSDPAPAPLADASPVDAAPPVVRQAIDVTAPATEPSSPPVTSDPSPPRAADPAPSLAVAEPAARSEPQISDAAAFGEPDASLAPMMPPLPADPTAEVAASAAPQPLVVAAQPPPAAEAVRAAEPAPAPAARIPDASGLSPGTGRMASGANLRSNPDNDAPVLATLSAGTPLQIVGCKGWCEVVVGDKRGFVYQKFLTQ